MRKAQDDVMARGFAEHKVGDILESRGLVDSVDHEPVQTGRQVVGEFEAVEFERSVTKVRGGGEVALRRVVLTGKWEVDPDAGR